MKLARKSFGAAYECAMPWPEDCFVQCGNGIVLKSGGMDDAIVDPVGFLGNIGKNISYRTAFFEAFPSDYFIRGEGSTIEEAEKQCWECFQKIESCPSHDWDRRGRKDGYAYCKLCGKGAMVLNPFSPCAGCGAVAYKLYSEDADGNPMCQPCHDKLPDDRLSATSVAIRRALERLRSRSN